MSSPWFSAVAVLAGVQVIVLALVVADLRVLLASLPFVVMSVGGLIASRAER